MLDTSICIHLMDVQPPHVVRRFRALALGQLVMSVVSFAELRQGAHRCPPADQAQADQSLRRLVQRVPVLAFEPRAAESYGVLAAAVSHRRGDALDRMMAAHALSVEATLVTHNESDFRIYPNLKIENWINPPA